jgi:hypothetical protein
LMQLAEELVGWHEEGILLQHSTHDDHRMGPHDVDNHVGAKLGEIVRSDHGIVVLRQDVVEPRFVLHDVVDARTVL